ncbi:manganese ion binding protein [Aureococcus anophagefferens]|nr:manganese ion binding protein [Aureococcus anophagefferens]
MACVRGRFRMLRPLAPLKHRRRTQPTREQSSSAAWAALDSIETTERVRVAGLLNAMAGLAGRRGFESFDFEDIRPNSMNPHRGAWRSDVRLPLSGNGGEALVRYVLRGSRLTAGDVALLMDAGAAALGKEPRVEDYVVSGRATVVGDLHGSLGDLGAAMELAGRPSPSNLVVFNGDFVDRGPDGVEVLCAVVALKLAFGPWVHLNRGNHEDASLSRVYDFEGELVAKYGDEAAPLLEKASDLFAALPLACVLEAGRSKTLVLHGCVPRDLPPLAAIRGAGRVDVLWSDPSGEVWEPAGVPNWSRGGAGCVVGDEALSAWLAREGVTRLVRSHETVATGAEVADLGAGRERWTVFSASRYPHREGLNKAAVLVVDDLGGVAPRRWDAGEGVESRADPEAVEKRVRGALAPPAPLRALAEAGLGPFKQPRRSPTSRAANGLFDLMDADHDGVLTADEFFAAVAAVNAALPAERRIDGESVWGCSTATATARSTRASSPRRWTGSRVC